MNYKMFNVGSGSEVLVNIDRITSVREDGINVIKAATSKEHSTDFRFEICMDGPWRIYVIFTTGSRKDAWRMMRDSLIV